MADQGLGDSATGAMAAAVAFLGALGAAIKFWPKDPGNEPENNEVRMLIVRVEKLESAVQVLAEQQRRTEQDREEANVMHGIIFDQLRITGEAVARIEGRLAG